MGRRQRPVDPMAGSLEAFAFDLRMLRTKAGEPSYRKLAQRAGVSASALSAAAGGTVLPSRRVTLAYVAACGADIDEWASRWDALRVELGQPSTDAPVWSRPSLDLVDRRKLALVDAVWQQWIHGYLRPAVENGGLIAPRMTAHDGKPIDVAALAGSLCGGRRIVMVGPPGIGKTIAGLALTRQLIVAGADPLPVFIRLRPGLPLPTRVLDDWWCDEILRRYGTSPALAKEWLDNGKLLPIFDGLDTLEEADRVACVRAVNAIGPCLLTCRTGVYEMVASTLGPHDVVRVRQLSLRQVQQCLSFEPDPELAELLTVPAFLQIALRIPGRQEADCQAVCAAFVHAAELDYPRHRLWHWLAWMAQFPTFDPRRLRIDMLSRRRDRQLVRGGSAAFVTAVVLALLEGAAWLATGWWREESEELAAASATGLIAALVCLGGIKSLAVIRRAMVLRLLIRRDALPRDLTRFLHAAHRARLLDQTSQGYGFAHARLRQYFVEGQPLGSQ